MEGEGGSNTAVGMNRTFSKPDFVCIGPTKTGTTWLFDNLSMHPEVWLPPVKECRYFWGVDKKPVEGASPLSNLKLRLIGYYYWDWRRKYVRRQLRLYRKLPYKLTAGHVWWDIKYLWARHTPEWYASLFHPEKCSGDIDGTYARYTDEHIQRLKDHVPRVKILMFFRDPVDRLWSVLRMRFIHMWKKDIETLSHDTICAEVDTVLKQYPDYLTLVRRWSEYFPAERMHYGYFETLQESPLEHFTDICHFLEISTNFSEELKRNLETIVFKGVKQTIPEEVQYYIAATTIDTTRQFYEYTQNPLVLGWLERAEGVMQSPPVQDRLSGK